MKFSHIEIQNFMAIRYAEIELDNQGLVLIKGNNEDNPSFQSNGAGKSSIIESIVYALFGRTIRGVKADDVVNKTSKCNCKICLTLIDDDESEYKIIRYRKHKTNKNSVFLYHNGNDITPKSELDLNKEIVKLLQTDYLTFTSSILYSSESFKFTQASDAEMKQAFEVMLDLGIYSRCQDEVKSEISELNSEINSVNLGISTIDSKIQVLEESCESLKNKSEQWIEETADKRQEYVETVNELKEQISEYQNDIKDSCDNDLEVVMSKLESLNARLLEIDEELKSFDETKSYLKDLESSESDLNKAIRSTKRKIEDLEQDTESSQRKKKKLQSTIESWNTKLDEDMGKVGTPCPVCGRPLEQEHLQSAIDEVNSEIQDCEEQKQLLENAITDNSKKIKKFTAKLSEYQELMEEVQQTMSETQETLEQSDKLEQEYRKVQNSIRDLEKSKLRLEKDKMSMLAKIESLQSQVQFYEDKLNDSSSVKNPYDEEIFGTLEKIKHVSEERQKYEKSLEELSKQNNVLQFWLKGFSNSGIKSMLLDDITPFLNERANKYLQVLSGSRVHVDFSTQTQLKSGEMREKFQIKVENEDGGDSYLSNSSGERRRIDVAINLALQDLIASRANKKLNIMFLDEILDTLDKSGTDNVIGLLAELSKEKSSIFVISHNDDIQSYFQNFLVITKKDCQSSVVRE